jgi:hypothetical protein
MKIYTLTIAYNEDTEEIEYIQEEMTENEEYTNEDFIIEYEEGYFSDEELLEMIETGEIGAA